MRKSVAALTAAISVFCVAISSHGDPIYTDTNLIVGRYSSYSASPEFDQLNPLAQIVTVKLPKNRIQTIGQAIQYLLHGSGYAQIASQDRPAVALMSKPLPEVHRQLGPMPLATALKTLVGRPYEVQVNDVQRSVRVELKKSVEPKPITVPPVMAANTAWETDRGR